MREGRRGQTVLLRERRQGPSNCNFGRRLARDLRREPSKAASRVRTHLREERHLHRPRQAGKDQLHAVRDLNVLRPDSDTAS